MSRRLQPEINRLPRVPPAQSRPLLRTVQDADNLDGYFSRDVDNHKGETGNRELPRTRLSTGAATARQVFQSTGRVTQSHRGTAGLRRSKTLFGVVADMRQVVRRWLGPTYGHLSWISGFDHSANVAVFNKLAFIRRGQALIDFA